MFLPCCDNDDNDDVVEEANAWTTTVVGHIASSNRLLSGDVFMVGASSLYLYWNAKLMMSGM